MKKKYIVIGLLASSLASFGQRNDTTYVKKHLRTRDVQVLLSYYTQDNDHSAVTGGIGTESLQVYASDFSMNTQRDSLHTFHFDTGIDLISSASTDKIDFVMSSASKTDARTHLNIGYNRKFKSQNFGLNTGLSIESDYYSRALGLSWNYVDEKRQRELSVSLQTFFDDLRWGRFDNGKPQKLIYPSELRTKEWFDTYKRKSYNLELGVYQTINRRMALGIYPGVVYQTGLLATPFHRVYFIGANLPRVENLPDSRLKIPMGLQFNTFIGNRWIVRTYYRFYWDDFGIVAHTFSVETPLKLGNAWSVTPLARLYTQSKADYFKPYQEHDTAEEFYTSDYDLSGFTSIKTGLGLRYRPVSNHSFREMEMRYSIYKRSDGLTAHIITSAFNFRTEKLTEKNKRRRN